MTTPAETFASREAHLEFLATQAAMPAGFRCGTTRLSFVSAVTGKTLPMTLTLLAADRPTGSFAARLTKNAFPGAPILLARRRLAGEHLGAIVVNNKSANVGVRSGVADAERVAAAAASALSVPAETVLSASTGVIGWALPVEDMCRALPDAVAALQSESILPAAQGIMTTDLYPKVRSARVGDGRIVAIAKGAGMVEPNMATMLVYVLTDVSIGRTDLDAALGQAVEASFNNISIDSDTSTSDMVVALSSNARPAVSREVFTQALTHVCQRLAEDVVRNGEGVHHVLRVDVTQAPDVAFARGLGKSIVNSPLVKTAICGNDPNVGRLLAAIGKYAGANDEVVDPERLTVRMGGHTLFAGGAFTLDAELERILSAYLAETELYRSAPSPEGAFTPPVDFPPHQKCVEVSVDLGMGAARCQVLGADLSHEYITENADYRS